MAGAGSSRAILKDEGAALGPPLVTEKEFRRKSYFFFPPFCLHFWTAVALNVSPL
jgi:hypothetical protein